MPQTYKFKAVIENAGGGGGFVQIPFDVEQAFGQKRVKVKAHIEGEPYRGTLVRMGGPNHMLIILKGIREKIGKTFGDKVEVTLQEDVEPRVVRLPPDLAGEFKKHPEVATFFRKLAYTHQKEYVGWIEEAKREATRKERVAKTIAMLKKGIKGR